HLIWLKFGTLEKNLSGGRSAVVPPDPMPNSEVKRRSADGSVGSPHARVGNCQTSNQAKGPVERSGLFAFTRPENCRMAAVPYPARVPPDKRSATRQLVNDLR